MPIDSLLVGGFVHFRVRKNVVQLIRTNYDAGKKKGVNTLVGTVNLAKPELSDEIKALLTTVELDEFDAWLKTQHRANTLREEVAALTLVDSMGLSERWFEREGDSQAARVVATDIVAQWQSLRRVMSKKGLLD